MTATKTERLMNLLIMLLVQPRHVPRSRIREAIYGDSSDEAFERMFDRDKEELRSLGVPVETGQIDVYFDDEPGYRIRPDDFALPQIDLAPDEAQVVGLATRVWEHQRLAGAAAGAVRKLAAAGVDIDLSALDVAPARLDAEPAFDVLLGALIERREVAFDYARPGQPPTRRRLQPWGVTRWSGRWYVLGHDLDRGEERVFRLSRVVGEPETVGDSDAYLIPPGLDIGAVTRRLAPQPEPGRAVLLVRAGTALPLRRRASAVEHGVVGPAGLDGAKATGEWDRLVLEQIGANLADDVLAHGAHVRVEEPAELRDQVVSRLRAAAEWAERGEWTR